MNVYHIIDHSGFGTIHKLLIPLSETYTNHKVYTPYLKKNRLTSDIVLQINNDQDCIIIIHSTGRIKTFYIDKLGEIFPNKKIYIFMHVSVNYELHKERALFLNCLLKTCKENDIVILTPSLEVSNQYKKIGLKTRTIQIGIPDELDSFYFKDIKRLKKYYNRVVTTCVCDNKGYYVAKGIDAFNNVMQEIGLEKIGLIAGLNSKNESILCKKFVEKDFLNILYHSLAYVQFSKFESYNVTAIYAKRFKIPTLLLKAEGNNTCMQGDVYIDYAELKQDLIKIVVDKMNIEHKLDKNYKDSIIRETLSKFNKDLLDLGGKNYE